MKLFIYRVLFLSIGAICLFGFQIPAYAESNILPEIISSELILLPENGAYFVNPNGTTVTPEGILTLMPGVTLHMADQPLIVKGQLKAQGLFNKKVIFDSSDSFKKRGIYIDENAIVGDFTNLKLINSSDGIIFSNSKNTNLSNIEINNSYHGITVLKGTSTINNVSISGSGSIELFGGASVTLNNIEVKNTEGVNIFNVKDSHIVLSNAFFENIQNSNGIKLSNSFFEGNNIKAIQGNDAFFDSYKSNFILSSSSISNFDTALNVTKSHFMIASTSILSNQNGIIINRGGGPIFSEKNKKDRSIAFKITHLLSNLFKAGVAFADENNIFNQTDRIITNSLISNNIKVGVDNHSYDVVNAKNNNWGSELGPYAILENPNGTGNSVIGNVLFNPWITSYFSPLKCCSSVIFIPGFEGSRLYAKGVLNTENQLWEPNRNADVEKLFMDVQGNSLTSDVYTKDIIDRSNITPFGIFDSDVYKGLIDRMNNLVASGTIKEFKIAPYDWRYSFASTSGKDISLQNSTYSIIDEIKRIASSSITKKVTLIGHSGGGLVIKELIKNIGSSSLLIDNLILVASPQIGSNSAVTGLLYGDNQSIGGGIILSKETAKNLGKNIPSAYDLLPQQGLTNESIIKFDTSVASKTDLIKKFGTSVTYENLDKFITHISESDTEAGDVNKTNLFESRNRFNLIKDLVLPSNINIFQIAAYGIDTIKDITYKMIKNCVKDLYGPCISYSFLDHIPSFQTSGDGTVSIKSALALSSTDFFVNLGRFNEENNKNFSHVNIMSAPIIGDILSYLVNKITAPFISDYVYTVGTSTYQSFQTQVENYDSKKVLEISVHSPVNLMITDSLGRKTGMYKIPNSDLNRIVEQIPNSSYKEIGEGKYVYLPDRSGFKVDLDAYDYGSFSLNIEHKKYETGVLGTDTSLPSFSFNNIPITSSSSATLNLLNELGPVLELDINGDNISDEIIPANSLKDIQLSTSTLSKISIKQKLILNLVNLRSLISFSQIKSHKKIALIKRVNHVLELLDKVKLSQQKQDALAKSIKKLFDKLSKNKLSLIDINESSNKSLIVEIDDSLDQLD